MAIQHSDLFAEVSTILMFLGVCLRCDIHGHVSHAVSGIEALHVYSCLLMFSEEIVCHIAKDKKGS